ncbi:hypothetical protein MKZ38_003076 [Zalerion maritima]|uniref:Uncharacterized protein n=1 Tax=Zalerion maritima TaxID=339359 RepID=A0AAD5WSK8_9PEZI|nr:hypothetical protein MKZ38_003076 [Zalerion maritima]
MVSSEPVTPDTELVLDAFPLPPEHNSSCINTPIAAGPPPLPPKAIELYQDKALPPLPPKFTKPIWGKRSTSLTPTPVLLKSASRPTTPVQRGSLSAPSLPSQRPRTASDDTRISAIENEIVTMSWIKPTKSVGESTTSSDVPPSLTDASRETSLDSRPENFQQALPTIDEPLSPKTKVRHIPEPIRTGIPSMAPSRISPQAQRSSKKIQALTGSDSVFINSPGLLSPTGHNLASKVRRFGIDLDDSGKISPGSSRHGSFSVPGSVSEPDDDESYIREALDTRPNHEAWMGPSPTLPPLEVDGSLGFVTERFQIQEVRRPTALKFTEGQSVRDLYHVSALEISEEEPKEDGTKATALEVGKPKKKAAPKSPAQYSFFPRKESFSARRRNSAAQGNKKLPPNPLTPKPKFATGKHPLRTPFPTGNLPLRAGPTTTGLTSGDFSTAELSTGGFTTPGLPMGATNHPTLLIGDDFSDIHPVDEVYRSQPTSAFDLDEDHKPRSFLSEKRIFALSHVFKRHPGSTSKEEKRRSKDSFASVGSHGFFKHSPKSTNTTPPKAFITTTIGTRDRASSFTSNESAGWFSSHFGAGAGSTTNTTPTSASAAKFSNPFSRSSTPVPGERCDDTEADDDTTPNEKRRMSIHAPPLHLQRSSGARISDHSGSTSPNPGSTGVWKSSSRRDRSAERRRNSMKNKIRIIPEGEVVETGVPNSMKSSPTSEKKSSNRISAHAWF